MTLSNDMTTCPKCGHRSPSWYAACEKCGARLSLMSSDSSQSHRIEREKIRNSQPEKLPIIVFVICGWPLILMFLGGAIGGALGGAAFGANLSIYKSKLPGIVKFVASLLVGILAIVIWYIVVRALLG